jgi:hypothetical protein
MEQKFKFSVGDTAFYVNHPTFNQLSIDKINFSQDSKKTSVIYLCSDKNEYEEKNLLTKREFLEYVSNL